MKSGNHFWKLLKTTSFAGLVLQSYSIQTYLWLCSSGKWLPERKKFRDLYKLASIQLQPRISFTLSRFGLANVPTASEFPYIKHSLLASASLKGIFKYWIWSATSTYTDSFHELFGHWKLKLSHEKTRKDLTGIQRNSCNSGLIWLSFAEFSINSSSKMQHRLDFADVAYTSFGPQRWGIVHFPKNKTWNCYNK